MNVPLNEQETVIQISRTEKAATIYTSDSTMMTKLDHRCKDAPEYYKLDRVETSEGDIVGKFYTVTDRKMVSLRGKKRIISDEQKEKFAERMKSLRNQNLAD